LLRNCAARRLVTLHLNRLGRLSTRCDGRCTFRSMPEFLTTHGVAFHVEGIITGAETRLVLISPYLRLSKTLLERLRDAGRRGVRTTLVYGKAELRADERRALAELPGLTRYFLENLHAKCYYNEARLVITSMNLHEFSEKTNREMGVLVTSEEPVYRAAVAEAESILSAAKHESSGSALPPTAPRAEAVPTADGTAIGTSVRHSRRRVRDGGVCIRCRRPIALNAERPLCGECYGVWAQYGDPDYPERACHACGRAWETSVRKPLCYNCYQRWTEW
jgi:hypothetical protein